MFVETLLYISVYITEDPLHNTYILSNLSS